MFEETFEHYEKKYLLTAEQYADLMGRIRPLLAEDRYPKYMVSSVYFDTKDYALIRRSLDRPVYKEKLRLRTYETEVAETTEVYAECKRKLNGIVYKRRMGLTLEEARRFFYYGLDMERKGQVYHELSYLLSHYELHPATCIFCEREAYLSISDPGLRITFDRNVLGRAAELDLRVKPYGQVLLKNGQVIMEVKFSRALPVWLSRLFSELGIYSVPYSKYGAYYLTYIRPRLDEEISRSIQGEEGAEKYMQEGLICA